MSRESLSVILERHTPELMRIPGVVGTGEGRDDGMPAFVVFVVRRTAELEARLPRRLGSYPVIIREAGEVKALEK